MTSPLFPETTKFVYCIGAQKAGTTWLYETLRTSNQIYFSRNKELHYFNVIAGKSEQVFNLRINTAKTLAKELAPERGPKNRRSLEILTELSDLLSIYTDEAGRHDAYLSYIARGFSGQPVICDITPAYAILDAKDFAEMRSLGETYFIFILRDPIDRMWSQIRMAVNADTTQIGDFQTACEARAQHLIDSNRLSKLERANYRRTMRELEAVIPMSRIKYVFYEDLFHAHTMRDICAFLGIMPIAPKTDLRSNTGRHAMLPEHLKDRFRAAFAPQYEFILGRFGSATPARWQINSALKVTG
jgi:hypothetical protein